MHTSLLPTILTVCFYVFALYFWLFVGLFTLLYSTTLVLLSLAESVIQFSVLFLKIRSY